MGVAVFSFQEDNRIVHLIVPLLYRIVGLAIIGSAIENVFKFGHIAAAFVGWSIDKIIGALESQPHMFSKQEFKTGGDAESGAGLA